MAKEVDHLLARVAESGCEFYRNGVWFKGPLGQSHLRTKYEYLVKRELITATSDFIEQVGTASSMTGLAYRVRCKGEPEYLSRDWLNNELTRYRTSAR